MNFIIWLIGGGLSGKGMAEAIDPTRERDHWSRKFTGRGYVEKGASCDDYGPAHGFGVSARNRYPGRELDDVESEMSREWATSRGGSRLSWERATPGIASVLRTDQRTPRTTADFA